MLLHKYQFIQHCKRSCDTVPSSFLFFSFKCLTIKLWTNPAVLCEALSVLLSLVCLPTHTHAHTLYAVRPASKHVKQSACIPSLSLPSSKGVWIFAPMCKCTLGQRPLRRPNEQEWKFTPCYSYYCHSLYHKDYKTVFLERSYTCKCVLDVRICSFLR